MYLAQDHVLSCLVGPGLDPGLCQAQALNHTGHVK